MNWLQFAVQWLHVLLGIALKDAPAFAAASGRVQRFAIIDLGLFGIVFTRMNLMRFGL